MVRWVKRLWEFWLTKVARMRVCIKLFVCVLIFKQIHIWKWINVLKFGISNILLLFIISCITPKVLEFKLFKGILLVSLNSKQLPNIISALISNYIFFLIFQTKITKQMVVLASTKQQDMLYIFFKLGNTAALPRWMKDAFFSVLSITSSDMVMPLWSS